MITETSTVRILALLALALQTISCSKSPQETIRSPNLEEFSTNVTRYYQEHWASLHPSISMIDSGVIVTVTAEEYAGTARPFWATYAQSSLCPPSEAALWDEGAFKLNIQIREALGAPVSCEKGWRAMYQSRTRKLIGVWSEPTSGLYCTIFQEGSQAFFASFNTSGKRQLLEVSESTNELGQRRFMSSTDNSSWTITTEGQLAHLQGGDERFRLEPTLPTLRIQSLLRQPTPEQEKNREKALRLEREEKTRRRPSNRWYEGGTLHRSDLGTWRKASYANRLATAADFAAKMRSYSSMDALKLDAVALERCISESAEEPALSGLKTAEVAAACAILMGW